MDQRIFAAVKTPLLFSRRRVDRVEEAVPTSEIKSALRIRRRRVHDVAGFEFPFQFTGNGIERVQVSVAAPEKNRALRDHRTRQENVVLIGDRLGLRLEAVNTFRFEAALTARGEFPFYRASLGIERVKFSIVAFRVNDSVRDCGSTRDWAAGGPLPNLAAGLGVDRIAVAVVATE